MYTFKTQLSVIFIIIFSLITITPATYAATTQLITDYHQIFIPCFTMQNQLRIAIRMYYRGNQPYYLVVNPYNFKTETAPIQSYRPRILIKDAPGYFKLSDIQNTPYIKALNKYTSAPYNTDNYGISHAEKATNGYFLTIDMCPSTKQFEKKFFQTLVNIASKNKQATPIGLSITGLWIIGHPAEFHWLLNQQAKGKLAITWINHSFSHIYYADVPMQNNFLLMPRTNVASEILATEKVLLQHHQLPSVFFRLPGLISDKNLILTLRNFGLIPLGADAWLAQDQQAHLGSIILVHGNSNEHEGIELIMPMLQHPDINLLPLNQLFQATSN